MGQHQAKQPLITRRFTTTLALTAVPKRAWTLKKGVTTPIPGYSVLFPDGHIHWLEVKDFERFYMSKTSPNEERGRVD